MRYTTNRRRAYMNILILGGTKFMGIHLVNKLLSQGHNITIATRGKAQDPLGTKVTRLIIDRQSQTSLETTFKGKHYDTTIDNIAYASNDIKYLLDVLKTDRYILTSTVSVYAPNFHMNMKEEEIDTKTLPLKWCNYQDVPYDEAKRQAEAALFQAYPSQQAAAVRFPYIFGNDDYTKRLYTYIENIFHQRAMHIDNLSARLSFINSQEAGHFLAHTATSSITGYVNAASTGTISLEEIIHYTEQLMGIKAIISKTGTPAPLNTTPSFGLDTSKATNSGFTFKNINEWVHELLHRWYSEFREVSEPLKRNTDPFA